MPQAITSYELEQKRIAARKKRNEQYYKRFIQNPKQRSIGIDEQALERQINEKKTAEMEAAEMEFNRTQQTEEILSVLETQKLEADAARAAENARYKALWDEQTNNKQFRREFDLNDKNALKKELPARVGDDDPRCGPASMQRFHGEDLNKNERVKQQKSQMRTWIQDATMKHDIDRKFAIEQDRAEAQYINAIEKLREENEMEKQALMRANTVATLRKNQELANFRDTMRMEEKAIEDQKGIEEVKLQSTSKFLNEDASQGVSSLDPRRYRVDHFKGMEMEKVQQIYGEVADQQKYRDDLRKKLKENDLQLARNTAEILDVLAMQNLKVKQDRQQMEYESATVLKRQIEEKAKRDLAEKNARRNLSIGTNSLLSGFGTSFR